MDSDDSIYDSDGVKKSLSGPYANKSTSEKPEYTGQKDHAWDGTIPPQGKCEWRPAVVGDSGIARFKKSGVQGFVVGMLVSVYIDPWGTARFYSQRFGDVTDAEILVSFNRSEKQK